MTSAEHAPGQHVPLDGTLPLRPGAMHWDGPFYRVLTCGRTRAEAIQEDQDLSLGIVEPHRMFLMTLLGEGIFRTQAGSHALPAGTVLAAPIPTRGYLCRREDCLPWVYIWANFAGAPAFALFDYIVDHFGNLQRHTLDSPLVEAATRLVEYARRQQLRANHEWSSLTFNLLNTWLASCSARQEARHTHPGSHIGGTRVLHRIPATVKNLAMELGYSRSHVSRKLSRQWKASPGKLLRHARLEEAARQLLNSDVPVGEVARQAGYATSSSFAQAFRRYFGVTPRDYRRPGLPATPAALRELIDPHPPVGGRPRRRRRRRL